MTARSKSSDTEAVDPPDEQPEEVSDPSSSPEDQSVPADGDPPQEQAGPDTGPRYPGDKNVYPDPENPLRSGY